MNALNLKNPGMVAVTVRAFVVCCAWVWLIGLHAMPHSQAPDGHGRGSEQHSFSSPKGSTQQVTRPAWQYTLLPGAEFVDDCLLCGRPTLILPMQGTFSLRLIDENPLFSTYAVEALSFTAGVLPGTFYKISGSGSYKVGGEVAVVQSMELKVEVDNGFTVKSCFFKSTSPGVTRAWPLVSISLEQSDGDMVQVFKMKFVAAPLREIWFSTKHGFTPGVQPPPARYVLGGDLVSDVGRVVRSNRELTGKLGLMPSPDPPDLGLDAVEILRGGEVAFSIEKDVFSETLGYLYEGDVLSDAGRIVVAYAGLVAPFSPMPPVWDPGLDALCVLPSGEVYFSVEKDFFSEKLGRMIRRGDLLSSKGYVVKTHEQLLEKFHLPPLPKDFGLDAIHVWPSGEIWFSLEDGFQDSVLGMIRDGDLLSDCGEVVYRNHELLRNFQPLEDLADFGLDAVFIVSDAMTLPVDGGRCKNMVMTVSEGFRIQWEANGRLRQVEKAPSVIGPWKPIGPVTLDTIFVDPEAPHGAPQAFYRLREW
ncbi:MAG: hypothetical protein N3G20_07900 [Verrucomicrobiae bacterium]|nr:hypothetical protein [Verrucomicrobiae bacterium]